MTRYSFVADVHLGNHKRVGGPVEVGMNRRCRETLDVLATAAAQRMGAAGVRDFIILGDLFDTSSPSPQLLQSTARRLDASGINVTLLVGNHDQVSTQDGDHALGILGYAIGGITIDQPKWCGDTLLVPHQPGPAKDWLPATLDRLMRAACSGPEFSTHGPVVLCMHLGLIDDGTPPYLRDAHDAVGVDLVQRLTEQYDIMAVFAGNWHTHKCWGLSVPIVQVGALVPTGWDNPGFDGYGKVVHFNTETRELHVDTVPGPRFLDAWSDAEALAHIARAERERHILYLRWRSAEPPGWDTEVLAGRLVVEPDRAGAVAAARTAATVARSAETFDRALHDYIEKMPLDEGVDRGRVLAKAKELLST